MAMGKGNLLKNKHLVKFEREKKRHYNDNNRRSN
jgi:hypothetical protein